MAIEGYPGPDIPQLEGVNDDAEWSNYGEKVFIGKNRPPARQVWSPLGWEPIVTADFPWRDGTLSFDLIGVTPISKSIGRVMRGQVLIRMDGRIETVDGNFYPHPEELELACEYWQENIENLHDRAEHFKEDVYFLRAGEWSDTSQVFLDDDSEESHMRERVSERRYESGVSVLSLLPRLEGGWYVLEPNKKEAIYSYTNYISNFFEIMRMRPLYLLKGERVKFGSEYGFGADGEPLLIADSIEELEQISRDDLYISKNVKISDLNSSFSHQRKKKQ